MGISVLYATFPDEQTAQRICKTLLDEDLVACANIFPPIRSIYKWQGKVEDSAEIAAFLKTRSEYFPALDRRLKELHPYETPCLLEIRAGKISGNYESWLLASLPGSK